MRPLLRAITVLVGQWIGAGENASMMQYAHIGNGGVLLAVADGFRTMTPREMIKLLKLATWENAEAGECFVERDKPLDRLMVIYSGKACAEVDGRNVTELQPGHFIGSINYVTDEPAPANVVAIEPTRYVCWPKSTLKDFMNKNPELHSALKSTLAIDLTRWLQATWARGTIQNATRTDSA